MLTPADMERVLESLDQRLTAVEQKLPTLATKDDLSTVRDEVRRHTDMRFEEARRHTDMRFEDMRDDIQKVAEAVAALSTTAAGNQRTLERVVERLDVHESLLVSLTKKRR